MKRSTILRFVLIALLLTTALWWTGRDATGPDRKSSAATGPGDRGGPVLPSAGKDGPPELATKHGDKPRDPALTGDAKDWSNRGGTIDGELPDVTRSQVRATVPAGHSMVIGGHPLADGTREFAMITPKWIEMPSGSKMVEMEVEMLHFDAEGIADAGLETLLTGERKSEQNAEVWTPEEVARTMESVKAGAARAKPKVVTTPGTPGRVRTGSGGEVQFELELSAGEAADGGFDLSSDLKRVD